MPRGPPYGDRLARRGDIAAENISKGSTSYSRNLPAAPAQCMSFAVDSTPHHCSQCWWYLRGTDYIGSLAMREPTGPFERGRRELEHPGPSHFARPWSSQLFFLIFQAFPQHSRAQLTV